MIPLNISKASIQRIEASWLAENNITLDVLRLDKIHEVVSGNKWFKLKYYLLAAVAESKRTIATFGGAWSNHIVACAYAAHEAALQSVGIIRGEKPAQLSATLTAAVKHGMRLIFVGRKEYDDKERIKKFYTHSDWLWINEGGYGTLGMMGSAEILQLVDASIYTHIVAAVGTGTMLASLLLSSTKNQQVIGISSMKGNYALENNVKELLADKEHPNFKIFHDYHFGGYGKHPSELITFINDVFRDHQLPLDIIYTGKTFYAIHDLAQKSFFESGSRILMIHSGGLQGNKSLPPKVLAF